MPFTTNNMLISGFANGVNLKYKLRKLANNFTSGCVYSSNLILSFIYVAGAFRCQIFGCNMSIVFHQSFILAHACPSHWLYANLYLYETVYLLVNSVV